MYGVVKDVWNSEYGVVKDAGAGEDARAVGAG